MFTYLYYSKSANQWCAVFAFTYYHSIWKYMLRGVCMVTFRQKTWTYGASTESMLTLSFESGHQVFVDRCAGLLTGCRMTPRPFFQRSSLNCCKKEAIWEVLIEIKDESKIQFKKIQISNSSIESDPDNKYLFSKKYIYYYIILY